MLGCVLCLADRGIDCYEEMFGWWSYLTGLASSRQGERGRAKALGLELLLLVVVVVMVVAASL